MPKAIHPTHNNEREESDLDVDRDRQELSNPNFGLTKSVFARVAVEGFSGKWNVAMTIQVLLAIYYLVGFLLHGDNDGFNTYYYHPERDEQSYEFVRTDVESFECEGYQLYRMDKGPTPQEPQEYSATNDGLPLFFWIIFLFYGFMIITFALFCSKALYAGNYNLVIGLVTFESKHNSPPKPIKFGVVFTVICNFSKGFVGSWFYEERCGFVMETSGPLGDANSLFDFSDQDIIFYAFLAYYASFGILCYFFIFCGCYFFCCKETERDSEFEGLEELGICCWIWAWVLYAVSFITYWLVRILLLACCVPGRGPGPGPGPSGHNGQFTCLSDG